MMPLTEVHDGLPNFCGAEDAVAEVLAGAADAPVFLPDSGIAFDRIRAACAVALHMHQPLTPAGGDDLRTAALIGNLQAMEAHPGVGDNPNAPVFRRCYARMGDFIPQLFAEGKAPRVMLEYSGTLLYGLQLMGANDVLDRLRSITCDSNFRRTVEWLGAPWGHAVAPSTPVQDFRLHVRAWQHHFAALFGLEALARVRGFSPSEMALPNHPDVAYAFVKTLRDCGFRWVLVQEHTVEQPANGHGPEKKHLPHRLVCTSSTGETAEIIAIIKTQGSDTKLVAQMQPYYEAKSLDRWELAGKSVPPLVTQIADGENGGVMMNEFPGKYCDAVRESSHSATPMMNVTEYLEHLTAAGIKTKDFPPLQPIFQHRLWQKMKPGDGPETLEKAIAQCKQEDGRFHMEGGSWTNNLSWVHGYENILGPMEKLSSRFNELVLKQKKLKTDETRFRKALFHLMTAETSCYRYWGQGIWTDYGRELIRRADEILAHDY
jgi:hypothetical protein